MKFIDGFLKLFSWLLLGSLNTTMLSAQETNCGVFLWEKEEVSVAYMGDREQLIQKRLEAFQQNGYWSCAYQSLGVDSTGCEQVRFKLGNYYDGAFVVVDSITKVLLDAFGVVLSSRLLSTTQLMKLKQKALDACVNKGYAMTKVWYEVDTFNVFQPIFRLKVKTYEYFKMGKVSWGNPMPLHELFWQSYLGLKEGDPFSYKKVKQAEKFLNQQAYVSVKSAARVSLQYGKGDIEFVVKPVRANTVDALVGLQSNSQTGESYFTGNVDFKLNNPFKKGKEIAVYWRSVDEGSQEFKFNYFQPNLFRSHFDIGGAVDFYQKQSSFQEVTRSVMIGHRTFNMGRVMATSQWFDSNTPDLGGQYLSLSSAGYGVGYELSTLDRFYAPKNGLKMNISTLWSNKNYLIPPDTLASSFDPSQTQWELKGDITAYLPLRESFIVTLKTKNGWRNSEVLYQNELYRVGGVNNMRGFNENQFFTKAYSINSLECQWFFEEYSYFMLLSDVGWIESVSRGVVASGGAGLHLKLGTANLLLLYVLGYEPDVPMRFDRGKVHMKVNARF